MSEGEFVGREWLDAAVDRYASGDGGFSTDRAPLLIIGEYGTGKSAFVDHLVANRGYVHHKCSHVRPLSLDPGRFARTLATQLATAFEDRYPQVLAQQQGVEITATQTIGTLVAGQATNVYIKNLVATGPLDLFVRLVVEPLTELVQEDPQPFVIVVDALDESLWFAERLSIIDLVATAGDFPAEVRWLATTRPDRAVLDRLRSAATIDLRIDSREDARNDCRRFIARALERADVSAAITAANIEPAAFAAATEEASDGNFLYLRLLIDGVASGSYPLTEVGALPMGLDAAYVDSLDALARRSGPNAWSESLRPVLGLLSVALEPLRFEQIVEFSGLDASAVQDALVRLEPLLTTETTGSRTTYRPFHSSLPEVLRDRDRNPTYWIDAAAFHGRIAQACRGDATTWNDVPFDRLDDYALAHLGRHLYLSGARRAPELLDLLAASWRNAKARRFHSDREFMADVDLAIDMVLDHGLPGLSDAFPLALGLSSLTELTVSTSPKVLALLARTGRLEEAQTRLDALDPAAAVGGLCRIAADCVADGDDEVAREHVRRAIQRALDADEMEIIESLVALCSGLQPVAGQPWFEELFEPVVAAVRNLNDLGVCVVMFSLLGESGATERASALADEALDALDDIEDPLQQLDAFSDFAQALEQLGDDGGAHQLREQAVQLASTLPLDDATVAGRVVGAYVASGQLAKGVDIALEFGLDRTRKDLVGAVRGRDDVETAFALLADDDAVRTRVMLVRRLAETHPQEALVHLRALEPVLEVTELKVRMLVSVLAAEDLFATDRARARSLIGEALDAAAADSERAAAAGAIDMMDTDTEAAILRTARVAAHHDGERTWSEQTVERVLTILEAKEPPWMFWFVDVNAWRAREFAIIASCFADLGADDRAAALVEDAISAAARAKLGSQADALGEIAEAVATIGAPSWRAATAERLLRAHVIAKGADYLRAAGALAQAASPGSGLVTEIAAVMRERIDELAERDAARLEKEDDDPDLVGGLEAFIGVMPALPHASGVEALDWLASHVAPLTVEGRANLLVPLVRAWWVLDPDGAGSAIQHLPSKADQAVAGIALAAAIAADDSERPEHAAVLAESIERALSGLTDLDWDDGFETASQYVAAWLPDTLDPEASHPCLDRVAAALWERDWRSVPTPILQEHGANAAKARADAADAIEAWTTALRDVLDEVEVPDDPDAPHPVLMAITGTDPNDPEQLLRTLYDELQLEAKRVVVFSVLVLVAVNHGDDRMADACMHWLAAASIWGQYVADAVAEPGDDLEVTNGARHLSATAADGLVHAAELLVSQGETERARSIVGLVVSEAERAYLMASIGRVLLEGEVDDEDAELAAALVDQAAGALEGVRIWWPAPLTAVAAALVRCGKDDEAQALLDQLTSDTYASDARDAIVGELVERGDVEIARELLEMNERTDPWAVHDSYSQMHDGPRVLAVELIERGDVQGAVEVLNEARLDIFANDAVNAGFEAVGKALSGIAGSDPVAAAAIAADALRAAADDGADRVLRVLGAMVPLLAVSGEEQLARCWLRLASIDPWSSA